MKNLVTLSISICLLATVNAEAKSLFPNGDPSFYYDMGGGGALPHSVSPGTQYYDLGGDFSYGLSCMAFDGKLSLSNLLNNYKESAENIQQAVLNNIEAGVIALPMATLARKNPRLYNMIHNNLLSAHKQFEIDTQSCQQIEQEASYGNNPYQQMFQQTKLNLWRDEQHQSNDVTIAKKKVADKIKKSGVVWIDGMKGGLGQQPVNLIGDTSTAGYNVLIHRNNRLLSDEKAPKDPRYAALYNQWDSPKLARQWIVAVVGDEHVKKQSDPSAPNKTTPGFGLLPATQAESEVITETMNKMIAGSEPMTAQNLESVSSTNVLITPMVISTIRNNPPNRQAILVQKIADEVAIQNTLEKALWAKKLLRIGGQVPEVLALDAAQKRINEAINRLNDEMQDLLLSNEVATQMSSRTVSAILNYDKMEKEAALRNMSPTTKPFKLEGGALKKEKHS